MPVTWKILILAAIVFGDALAFVLIAPRMIRQGKAPVALVLAMGMMMSLAVVGGVLFFVVE